MAYYDFLDYFFKWMIDLNPTLAIFLFALIISLITVFAMKFLSNQKEMKRLKEEMDDLKSQMKLIRTDPKKVMAIQKELMKLQGQYSKHIWKVNFYTLVPIIFLFGWINAHFAFMPLYPDQPFNASLYFSEEVAPSSINISAPASLVLLNKSPDNESKNFIYTFKAPEGKYNLSLNVNGYPYSKEIIVSSRQEYAPIEEKYKLGPLKKIKLSNKSTRINLGIRMFAYKGSHQNQKFSDKTI